MFCCCSVLIFVPLGKLPNMGANYFLFSLLQMLLLMLMGWEWSLY